MLQQAAGDPAPRRDLRHPRGERASRAAFPRARHPALAQVKADFPVTAADIPRPGHHLLAHPGGNNAAKVHDGWMWDLTVPGNNDYDFYVIAGAASTLVHNDDGCSRAARLAGRVIQRAQNGNRSPTAGYHGRLPADLETDIMANPDAVYQSGGTAGRFVFRQGDNVAVTEGPGSSVGKLVTSYGPAGPRGESGGRHLRRVAG